jgi:Xaa-Pro dipeptidase
MDITPRHKNIQRELEHLQLDAALILKPHNIAYFTGYAPVCSGMVLFPDLNPVFCTLWLDAPEVKRRCKVADVTSYVFPRERLAAKMAAVMKKKKPWIRVIGIEKDTLLFRDHEMLSQVFPDACFIDLTPSIDRLRAIKSDEEITYISRSASISDAAMEAALAAVAPGVTELDIAAEAEYVMMKEGSEHPAFSTFVASGERTLLAHPLASKKKIRQGEPVVIDLGATWQGYASDLCRTTFVGDPTPAQLECLHAVMDAQKAATAAAKDGALCADLFRAAYEAFSLRGLGALLPQDIGYGVGLRQSEFHPVVEKGSSTVLVQNMVIALLQTTAYSKKTGGLRIEDTFLVKKDGCERLTHHTPPLFD